jgi:glycerol-3-phosphate dehydrogenase
MAREVEDLLARRCRLLLLDAAEAGRHSDAVTAILSEALCRAVDAIGFKTLAALYLRLPSSSSRAG